MVKLISNLFGDEILATLAMSFVPLIELKGGIVFARGLGHNFFEALGLAFLGSSLAIFPVFFLLKPLLNLLKKIKAVAKIADKAETYVSSAAHKAVAEQKKIGKKPLSEVSIKQLAVYIFVAIPLPMTGIWMGTAIAVFLNMKFKQAILPCLLGNLTAGVIISILAEVCLAFWEIIVLDYILYALFGIAILLLGVTIYKVLSQKTKAEKSITETEKE